MMKRLGLWVLMLLVLLPGAVFAQAADQIPFPNLGYDPGQWKYIIDGFYQAFFIFKMIAGRCTDGGDCSQALFYLALSAGLVGGLLFLFNPKFQRVPVIASWIALVFLLIIGPYSVSNKTANLFFYTFGANDSNPDGSSFANQDQSMCISGTESECGITAFMPQLMAIHTISTIHQALYYALYRCQSNGQCYLRDPISEILAESSFRGLEEVFNTGPEHPYMAYEAAMLSGMCSMGANSLNKIPYNPDVYPTLAAIYGTGGDNPMLSPGQHANMRQKGFTINKIIDAFDTGRLAPESGTGVYPPIALLMTQSDYTLLRDASLAESHTDGGSSSPAAESLENELQARRLALKNIFLSYNLLDASEESQLEENIATGNGSAADTFLDTKANSNNGYNYIITRRPDLSSRGHSAEDINDVGHASFLVGSYALSAENRNAENYSNDTLFNRARKKNNLGDFTGFDASNTTLIRERFMRAEVIDMPVFMGIYRPPIDLPDDVRRARNDYTTTTYSANSKPVLGGWTPAGVPTGFWEGLGWAVDFVTGFAGSGEQMARYRGAMLKTPEDMSPLWRVENAETPYSSNNNLFRNSIIRDCADLHSQYTQRRLFVMLDSAGYGVASQAEWFKLDASNVFQVFRSSGGSGRYDFVDATRTKIRRAYELRFRRAYENATASDSADPSIAGSGAQLGNAARAKLLGDMLLYNWVTDSNNRLAVMNTNFGRDHNVEAAVEDYQLPVAGSMIGSVGNFIAESTLAAVAQFVGVAATIYLNFITKLIDLALMAILMFTPLFFLMGLLIPSHAPGLLVLSVMTVIVLKTVPIMLMLVNICLAMVFRVLGYSADQYFSNLDAAIILFAAGGLYTGIVGITMFILFKIGDASSNMQMLTKLDDAGRKIGESFEKAAYTALAFAGAAAGGGAGAFGQAVTSGKGNALKRLSQGVGAGVVGAATQSTDVLTKGLAQIPGAGNIGGEIFNSFNEGRGQGYGIAKNTDGVKGYVNDTLAEPWEAQKKKQEDRIKSAEARRAEKEVSEGTWGDTLEGTRRQSRMKTHRAEGRAEQYYKEALKDTNLTDDERKQLMAGLTKALGNSNMNTDGVFRDIYGETVNVDHGLSALTSRSKINKMVSENDEYDNATDAASHIADVLTELSRNNDGSDRKIFAGSLHKEYDSATGKTTVTAQLDAKFAQDDAAVAELNALVQQMGYQLEKTKNEQGEDTYRLKGAETTYQATAVPSSTP